MHIDVYVGYRVIPCLDAVIAYMRQTQDTLTKTKQCNTTQHNTNPKAAPACAARVRVLGLCVCVCVSLFITLHLTTSVITRTTSELTYSAVDEGRNVLSDSPTHSLSKVMIYTCSLCILHLGSCMCPYLFLTAVLYNDCYAAY